MCGEQGGQHAAVVHELGSPPRVRGTAVCPHRLDGPPGITPACAGNSAAITFLISGGKDHPRVCGEQVDSLTWFEEVVGSPPRVRGTACLCDCVAQAWGITPACAGNRPPEIPCKSGTPDHPRVCGEQEDFQTDPQVRLGSPPRVRGTGFPWLDSRRPRRITPACAGNSNIFVKHIDKT